MKFIQENFILLIILAIVIYLVYKFLDKRKKTEQINTNNIKTIDTAIKNVISSNTGSVITTNSSQVSNTQVNTQSINSNWKIGDKIYAGLNGCNTYNNTSSGVNSLVKHYNSNDYIGTYLTTVNGYAKLIVENKVNALLETFGYEDNQIVYAIINQVYSKK